MTDSLGFIATGSSTKKAGYAKGRYHTFGPYLFGITGLRVDGDSLVISLATEKWSAILTFDLTPAYH